MTATPLLATRRFVLRPLVREDAAPLFASFGDPETMRWWSRGPFASIEELADYLVPPPGEWPGGRSWAVAASESGLAIARLAAVDHGDGVSELSYVVVPGHQGQGVAREALSALIDHLFGREHYRRLFCDVDPENEGSNRLCQRLGFTLEGRLREAATTHLGPRDALIWGLLAREWRAARLG